MEDCRIVALFLARAEEAIAALNEKYGRLIRRIALNILKCDADAEEIASDTALAVWDTVPPNEPDPLSPYVCRIARNLALDRYRYNNAARRQSGGDVLLSEIGDIVSDTAGAEDESMASLVAAAVSDFLRTRSAEERRLFVRRYWYGDAVEEIARDLGITANGASVKLHRMRTRLRAFLTERGITV